MYTKSAFESSFTVHTRYVQQLTTGGYEKKVRAEGVGMEAEYVHGTAGADAEFRAQLVGGEGDVTGGDFGLRIILAEGFDGPLV